MKKLSLLLITFCACLLYISCEESSDTPEGSDNQNTKLEVDEIAIAREAIQTPEIVYSLGDDAVNAAAATLYQAGLVTGTLTTSGTIQESTQGFIYNPQPNDRLVYQDRNGQNLASFMFNRIEGTLNGDDRDFLNNSHRFEFSVEVPGQGNLDIASINDGQVRSITLEGTVMHEGQEYEVNLLIAGTYFFNVDNTGFELRIDAQYTGTIVGNNFLEEVDENWKYNSVSATGGFFAENVFRSFTSAWTVGETRFQYQNGVLQSVFRDGRPTEWDVNNSPWNAEGTLLVNGQPVGNLTMGSEGNFIKVWLQLGEDREELMSWRL